MATGKGAEIFDFAEKLATELSEAGLDVLYDDRKASPGVKFADSEILGMPTTVVVGRDLANGLVELRDRASGEKRTVASEDVLAEVLKEIRG